MPCKDAPQLPSDQREIIRQILAYVIVHPQAKDTLEGISKWWGPKGHMESSIAEIQDGLNFLVARGWMRERVVTPTPKIYGMNKGRLAQIKAFLHELECKTAEEKGQKRKMLCTNEGNENLRILNWII